MKYNNGRQEGDRGMKRVLLVSSSEQGVALLLNLLSEAGEMRTHTVRNGEQARKALLLEDFDLVIINGPLSDEYGYEVARMAAEQKETDVMLLLKAEQMEHASRFLPVHDVLVVTKPFKRAMFLHVFRYLQAKQETLALLKRENAQMQEKLQEINILNRAKLVLMEVLKMTEAQAHRYLEKQAMDLRISKREVAEGILKTYEN